jgi:hypothetical protein
MEAQFGLNSRDLSLPPVPTQVRGATDVAERSALFLGPSQSDPKPARTQALLTRSKLLPGGSSPGGRLGKPLRDAKTGLSLAHQDLPGANPAGASWPGQLNPQQQKSLESLRDHPDMKDLLQHKSFSSLPETARAQILGSLSQDPKQADQQLDNLAQVCWTLENHDLDEKDRVAAFQVAASLKKEHMGLLYSNLDKGTLTSPGSTGKTGLQSLATLTQGSLVKDLTGRPLDREGLMTQILSDLDDKRQIFQGDQNTCGATSASILLAERDPGEYVRILADLARDGKTQLRNHKDELAVHREALKPDTHYRSMTGNLLQPALMDFANGDQVTYDDVTEQQKVVGSANLFTSIADVVAGPLGPKAQRHHHRCGNHSLALQSGGPDSARDGSPDQRAAGRPISGQGRRHRCLGCCEGGQ